MAGEQAELLPPCLPRLPVPVARRTGMLTF